MTSLNGQKGFSLIETLIGTAIFVVLALSAYRAFGVLMDAVVSSRAKLAATALANEKFETIRNLPYQDVGIVAGLPPGKIQRTVVNVVDNYSFTVESSVRSIDDPFDGTIGGNPLDTSPADYKLADLDITCSNCKIFSPLNFTTLIAPHALETASTNGALFIQVFDASGIPIQGASVHIVNKDTNPDTVIDETTDNSGWIRIVDAPPGTNSYSITATKSGYTTDQTYPLGGTAGIEPVKPDATVVVQQVTQTAFSIDRVSSLNVSSVSPACVVLPSVGFSLQGTKLIGAPDILKYPAQNFTTSAAGNFQISNLEWDSYFAQLTSPAFDLAGSIPFPGFTINPNESPTLKMVVTPHVDKALLVSVEDSAGNPLDGASVRLTNSPFDQTKTTNSVPLCPTPGQAFWNGLASGTYTLTITLAGFEDSITSVDVSANWQNANIVLTPN